jgi:hypothetical protein
MDEKEQISQEQRKENIRMKELLDLALVQNAELKRLHQRSAPADPAAVPQAAVPLLSDAATGVVAPAPAAAISPATSWACGACTYVNPGGKRVCQMCEHPR